MCAQGLRGKWLPGARNADGAEYDEWCIRALPFAARADRNSRTAVLLHYWAMRSQAGKERPCHQSTDRHARRAEYPQGRLGFKAAALDQRCRLPTHSNLLGHHRVGPAGAIPVSLGAGWSNHSQ